MPCKPATGQCREDKQKVQRASPAKSERPAGITRPAAPATSEPEKVMPPMSRPSDVDRVVLSGRSDKRQSRCKTASPIAMRAAAPDRRR